MSAVPKKKLCWNCEGNVSKEIDNCPYCGVYLHAEEEDTFWNPSRESSPSQELEEEQSVPSPLYQISAQAEDIADHSKAEEKEDKPYLPTFAQLKHDIFPVFFLMSGSVCLLFGIILLLFSHEGSLTLQWNGDHWIYFLTLSIPFLCYGWRCLQQMESDQD